MKYRMYVLTPEGRYIIVNVAAKSKTGKPPNTTTVAV